MTDRYDVVVVGGGIAGLVAVTVASIRAQVALVESRRMGGRARTSTHEGFHFNHGPHALYLGGTLMAACTRLGVTTAGGPPALRRARVWWDGRLGRLPLTPKAVLASRTPRAAIKAGGESGVLAVRQRRRHSVCPPQPDRVVGRHQGPGRPHGVRRDVRPPVHVRRRAHRDQRRGGDPPVPARPAGRALPRRGLAAIGRRVELGGTVGRGHDHRMSPRCRTP